jgi:FtsP/CotA-like multicopper oxidase with cupredoxin domain
MSAGSAVPDAKAMTHDMTDMDMSSHGMDPSGEGMNDGSQMDMLEMMTADKVSGGSQALPGTDHPPSKQTMMKSRIDEPGTGLENTGTRVLVYGDLRSVKAAYDPRPPEREIELHLTGNMERYLWSFDGKKYSEDHEPIPFKYGERLRITFVNDTMMDHPIHLHGMWMELDNGAGRRKPRKHTVSVKPAERLAVNVTADAMGKWALHCHLFYHMTVGMFREVAVADPIAEIKK